MTIIGTMKSIRQPQQMVCGFKLARQLLEAGVSLDTFFYYLHFPNTGKHFLYRNKTAFKTFRFNLDKGIDCQLIPAPLSEELMELMEGSYLTWWTLNHSAGKQWFCSHESTARVQIIKCGKNEANARAKVLICLLEKT